MARVSLLTPESAGEEAGSLLAGLSAQLDIFRVMAHADSCFAPRLQLGASEGQRVFEATRSTSDT